MTKSITYVAFLRGINVGGHKPIKMDALKKTLESMGFRNVKTILASGNVLFESAGAARKMAKLIEEVLQKSFGHKVGVILRTRADIQALVGSDPFKGVKVTPDTRLYVTFLSGESKSARNTAYDSPEKDFRILSISAGEVCSVLTLSPKHGTTDYMKYLEKQFGRNITTRNWNTILKINEH